MRAELRDALEFPYADSKVSKRPTLAARLDVPRGGILAVHVLLDDLEPGSGIRLQLRQRPQARMTVSRPAVFTPGRNMAAVNTTGVSPTPHCFRREARAAGSNPKASG